MVERHSESSANYWQLVGNFYLDLSPELFSACSKTSRQIYHRQRIQRVRQNTGNDQEDQPAEGKQSRRLSRLSAKIFPRRNKSAAASEEAASSDISAGGVLLGMASNRLQKQKHEATGASKQRAARTKGPSVTGGSALRNLVLEQIVSESSSSNIAATNRSAIASSSSEVTPPTELSSTLDLAFEPPPSTIEEEGKVQDRMRKE
jgi:hypothetical protein